MTEVASPPQSRSRRGPRRSRGTSRPSRWAAPPARRRAPRHHTRARAFLRCHSPTSPTGPVAASAHRARGRHPTRAIGSANTRGRPVTSFATYTIPIPEEVRLIRASFHNIHSSTRGISTCSAGPPLPSAAPACRTRRRPVPMPRALPRRSRRESLPSRCSPRLALRPLPRRPSNAHHQIYASLYMEFLLHFFSSCSALRRLLVSTGR